MPWPIPRSAANFLRRKTPAKSPKAKVAEIHRDIAVLEATQGAKTWYEAWADFTERAKVYKGLGNHDLRDKVEAWAEENKLKADFASEADEMRSPLPRLKR